MHLRAHIYTHLGAIIIVAGEASEAGSNNLHIRRGLMVHLLWPKGAAFKHYLGRLYTRAWCSVMLQSVKPAVAERRRNVWGNGPDPEKAGK